MSNSNTVVNIRRQEPPIAERPAERIWTLKQLMIACRDRVPEIMRQIDLMFADPTLMPADRMKLMQLVLDRGFGKPRQYLTLAGDNSDGAGGASLVRVYIPDNNRGPPTKTIDSVTLETVVEVVVPQDDEDDEDEDD